MEGEVCSICGDNAVVETNTTHTCHRLGCGHVFHVNCIVQWFAHGHQTCPNCRSEDMEEHMVRRNASHRIAAARRRKSTPTHIKRLIKQYDDTRTRAADVRRQLNEHRRSESDVYRIGNRLSSRVYHYKRRVQLLRSRIGGMCIAGVPLVDRFRILPDEDDDEVFMG